MIFAIFSRKNGSKKQEDFWKAKKSHFEASRANCGRSAAVRAGPGEGIKGWGKALGAGILDGFWEGLGRPKSSIFAIFSRKNGGKKYDDLWKPKKTHFEASKRNFP